MGDYLGPSFASSSSLFKEPDTEGIMEFAEVVVIPESRDECITRLTRGNNLVQLDDLSLMFCDSAEFQRLFDLWAGSCKISPTKEIWVLELSETGIRGRQLFNSMEIENILKGLVENSTFIGLVTSRTNHVKYTVPRIIDFYNDLNRMSLRGSWINGMEIYERLLGKIARLADEGLLTDSMISDLRNLLTDRGYPELILKVKDGVYYGLTRGLYNEFWSLIKRKKTHRFEAIDQYFRAMDVGYEGSSEVAYGYIIDMSGFNGLSEQFRGLPCHWLIQAPYADEQVVRPFNEFLSLFYRQVSQADIKRFFNNSNSKVHRYYKELKNALNTQWNVPVPKRMPPVRILKEGYSYDMVKGLIAAMMNEAADVLKTRNDPLKYYSGIKNFVGNSIYKDARILPTFNEIVDGKHINFIITLTFKGDALKRFLGDIFSKYGSVSKAKLFGNRFNDWIRKAELGGAIDLEFNWSTRQASLGRHKIVFSDAKELFNENNKYGINAVIANLFENDDFLRVLCEKLDRDFDTLVTRLTQWEKGVDWTNPDFYAIPTDGSKYYYKIQTKVLRTDDYGEVLWDQFKSLKIPGTGYETITAHAIGSKYADNMMHYNEPLLRKANELNAGIINIGVWNVSTDSEGILYLDQLLAGVKIAQKNGITDPFGVIQLLKVKYNSFFGSNKVWNFASRELDIQMLAELLNLADEMDWMLEILVKYASVYLSNGSPSIGLDSMVIYGEINSITRSFINGL